MNLHRLAWFAAVTGFACAHGALADTSPIVTEAVIPAPIDAVWSAYTTRTGLEAWAVAKSSEMELRVGGVWLTSYDRASELDGDDVIRNEVLAFDPGRMLALRTVQPPNDFPFPRAILRAWTVMYFEPLGPDQTRVVTKMFGFTRDGESQNMRAFFERGNAYELRKLAQHFGAQERTSDR